VRAAGAVFQLEGHKVTKKAKEFMEHPFVSFDDACGAAMPAGNRAPSQKSCLGPDFRRDERRARGEKRSILTGPSQSFSGDIE
jgi:hypothetical protein